MQNKNEAASVTKHAAEIDPSAPMCDTRGPALIEGFAQDEQGHWFAQLSCGHTQHLRHQPPWQNRAWVVDPIQRQAAVGTPMLCGWCAQGTEKP